MAKALVFITAAAMLLVAACGSPTSVDAAYERYLQAAETAADALDAVHDEESAEAAADAYVALNNEFVVAMDTFRTFSAEDSRRAGPRANPRGEAVLKRLMNGLVFKLSAYPAAANRVTEHLKATNKLVAARYRARQAEQ